LATLALATGLDLLLLASSLAFGLGFVAVVGDEVEQGILCFFGSKSFLTISRLMCMSVKHTFL